MIQKVGDALIYIAWAIRFFLGSTLFGQWRRWRVVQKMVITDDQILLVLHSSPRIWEFPDGDIEKDEELAAAVVREVWEETGVTVEVVRLIGTYQRLGFRPHDGIAFLCRPIAGTPRQMGDETVAVRYFPLDRLPGGLLPWYHEVIADALAAADAPVTRRRWLGLREVVASLRIVLDERWGKGASESANNKE